MGVTTNLINKPLNPRAQDASPLAFNRAKLYSGKALDFDGVNDSVTLSDTTIGSVWTWVSIIEADALSGYQGLFGGDYTSTNAAIFFTDANLNFFTDDANINTSFTFETGKKYHIACSQSGDTISVYVNGQAAGSVSLTATMNGIFVIGKNPYAAQLREYFNGKISGTKIFNTALTAAQIADLYNNPEKIVPTGVDNTALKLWLPMMEGAGTTAFNGAPDALGSELITNGDFSDGTNNWTAENSVISAANNQLIVDDSTNLGSDSRATQTFTTEVGKKYRLVFTKVDTSSLFYLSIGAGSSYNNIFYSSLGTDTGIHTIEFTATDTTTTLALITGGTGISVFANVSIKEQSGFGTISGATWTNGIGAPVAQTSVIDWNKASDGTNEVLLPQGLTTGRDITGVNLFENVRKQGALNLDGSSWSEVHDNESVDLTTAISMECWAYIDDLVSTRVFFAKWAADSAQRAYVLYQSGDDLALTLSDGSNYGTSSANVLTAGWHHIVATYVQNGNMTYYVDGSQTDAFAFTRAIRTTTAKIEIGRNEGPTGANYFDDQLAQPRIYNRALTNEEIQRNYNAGKNIYS